MYATPCPVLHLMQNNAGSQAAMADQGPPPLFATTFAEQSFTESDGLGRRLSYFLPHALPYLLPLVPPSC